MFYALVGPLLARLPTDNPNEMPAVWCQFSMGILLISLGPWVGARFSRPGAWARPLAATTG